MMPEVREFSGRDNVIFRPVEYHAGFLEAAWRNILEPYRGDE